MCVGVCVLAFACIFTFQRERVLLFRFVYFCVSAGVYAHVSLPPGLLSQLRVSALQRLVLQQPLLILQIVMAKNSHKSIRWVTVGPISQSVDKDTQAYTCTARDQRQ